MFRIIFTRWALGLSVLLGGLTGAFRGRFGSDPIYVYL